MAKWHGKIGYAVTVETEPGIWDEQITERKHYGDVLKFNRRLQTTDKLNDDINVGNEISIIADPFANSHFYSMRYIEFMGAKWKITNVNVQHPRLILSIGGLYNG